METGAQGGVGLEEQEKMRAKARGGGREGWGNRVTETVAETWRPRGK